MNRSLLRIACAMCACAFVNLSLGQASADEPRGSTPPGTSTDGSRPSDGAINGGTILPGENGGVPDSARDAANPAERLKRCNELTGSLREQCLKKESEASTGGSKTPQSTQPLPTDPPPQNPR